MSELVPADPEFAAQAPRVLGYLADRVPALRSHVVRMRKGGTAVPRRRRALAMPGC